MKRLPLAIFLITVFANSSHLFAATIQVDSTSDDIANTTDCTLRDAVSAAETDLPVDGCATGAGDDVIRLPSGTYLLTQGELAITTNITIAGSGVGTTTIDANANGRAMNISGGSTLVIKDAKLTNGNMSGSGGFAKLSSSTLQLIRVQCTANVASSNGGCINATGANTLTIIDSEFDNNSVGATKYGGVIVATNSSATTANISITDSYFHDNTAGKGGVLVTSPGSSGTIATTITNSFFANNSATGGNGGALSFIGYTNLATIDKSLFYQNNATNGGAVLEDSASNTTELNIINSSFVKNQVTNSGGAVNAQKILNVSHSTFMDNHADNQGGGMSYDGGSPTNVKIVNSILYGNTATNFGPSCKINSAIGLTKGNIIEDTTDCEVFTGTNDIIGVDPSLSYIYKGGDWNTITVSIRSIAYQNSDCTDVNGDTVTVDQRGYSRPSGLCTSGAYELLDFFDARVRYEGEMHLGSMNPVWLIFLAVFALCRRKKLPGCLKQQ